MKVENKEFVQRKIRQLVYLYALHVQNLYGKIPVNQDKEYKRIYADYQAGFITVEDIEADMKEFLQLQKKTT